MSLLFWRKTRDIAPENSLPVAVTEDTPLPVQLFTAADNTNIGNVDIGALPAANLGQRAMAASLSTVPASDITDATYIGDVKFGEALPAGTANIGDVDVASIAAGDNNIGNVDVASLPAGNLGQQASAASLSVTPATDVADATYIGDVKFGEALPAGTANIGDVDVASLPAGNLGQQISAASLSVTPATDVADATYIGDVKFGEALPAGTNAIGKLAANDGVDIGNVDVASIAAGDNNIGNVDVASIAAGDNNIGNVDVASLPAGAPADNGEVAGSATAAQCPTLTLTRGVYIKAAYDNAGRIYIGLTGVTKKDGTTDTTTGIELNAGDVMFFPVANLNQLYYICDNAGDDFTYIGW